MKELQASCDRGDLIYVLMVAGLTDVLIKSVEEGKSMYALLVSHICLPIFFSPFVLSDIEVFGNMKTLKLTFGCGNISICINYSLV